MEYLIPDNVFSKLDDYAPYGTPLFIAVSKKYVFGIDESEFYNSEDW